MSDLLMIEWRLKKDSYRIDTLGILDVYQDILYQINAYGNIIKELDKGRTYYDFVITVPYDKYERCLKSIVDNNQYEFDIEHFVVEIISKAIVKEIEYDLANSSVNIIGSLIKPERIDFDRLTKI